MVIKPASLDELTWGKGTENRAKDQDLWNLIFNDQIESNLPERENNNEKWERGEKPGEHHGSQEET